MVSRRSFLGALLALPFIQGLVSVPAKIKAKSDWVLGDMLYPRTVTVDDHVPDWSDSILLVRYQGRRVRPHDILMNLRTREQVFVHMLRGDVLHVTRGFCSVPLYMGKSDLLILVSTREI